jgi:translation initiation factor 6 (eIF-6)
MKEFHLHVLQGEIIPISFSSRTGGTLYSEVCTVGFVKVIERTLHVVIVHIVIRHVSLISEPSVGNKNGYCVASVPYQ